MLNMIFQYGGEPVLIQRILIGCKAILVNFNISFCIISLLITHNIVLDRVKYVHCYTQINKIIDSLS